MKLWVEIYNKSLLVLLWVQNDFGQSKSFVQIIKISTEKSNLNPNKMIWTRPKLFGPGHNNLYSSKTIWTVQNNFGPAEGQGIKLLQTKQLRSRYSRCCGATTKSKKL